MADTGVKYTVTVVKEGTGGAQAAAELNTAAAAAQKTNTAFAQSETATAGAAKGFKALHGVLTIAGLQTFPQLTAGVMVTKSAIDGLRASNVQLQASVGLVTAGIAGLAAAVVSGAMAWAAYAAEKNQALTEKNLDAQTDEFASRIKNQLTEALNAGRITTEVYDKLSHTLGTLAGNQQVRDFFKDLNRGSAGERIAGFNRSSAFTDAINARDYPNMTQAQQALNIKMKFNDEQQLYNDLLNESLITEKQMHDLTLEANTQQINSLTQLKNHLTDVQVLGRDVAKLFASGFSQAFVDFASGTKSAKEAFSDFARSFLQSVSQMIMEWAILKGMSAMGMTMAHGGVRFAADGLAGVQSVSSPTYFPKFNVVAGEAGREMLTVLARPRMMEVGGMQAVVGSAQGNRLAITNADELASRGGAGGVVDIRVTLGPELRAEIVNQSVQGARVVVANDMRADTPISRGVKGLAA
jgi:hypothetical protein